MLVNDENGSQLLNAMIVWVSNTVLGGLQGRFILSLRLE